MNDPISTIDICNLALSKLGEAPISYLSASSSQASRQCYMHYHPARRELLCAHRWSFAQKLIDIKNETFEGDGASAEHLIHHNLPSDCLRVLSVNQQSWTLRGRSIYCHSPEIRVLYCYDCEDTELFEPLFIEALATLLACKMCLALTSSTTARQQLTEEYRRISLPNAAHFNAVQDRSNDSHPLYRLWKQSALGKGDNTELDA